MARRERIIWLAVVLLSVIIAASLSGDTKTVTKTVTKEVRPPAYVQTKIETTTVKVPAKRNESCDMYYKAVDKLDQAMDAIGSMSGEIDAVVSDLAVAAYDPESNEAVQLTKRVNKLNASLTPMWLVAGKAQADMQTYSKECRGS